MVQPWTRSNSAQETLRCYTLAFSHITCHGSFCTSLRQPFYIPPSADASVARELLHNVESQLHRPCPLFLETNHTLSSILCTFTQYVNCSSRENKIHAKAKDAYSFSPLPSLGYSDHNLVHLLPFTFPSVYIPGESTWYRKWSADHIGRTMTV